MIPRVSQPHKEGGEVLAYTVNKVCYGIQGGIRNVLIEESRCEKKPAKD